MDRVKLAKKYYDDMCHTYEDLRANTYKWLREQKIVHDFLTRFPRGTKVLDIPIGTGRFIEFYEKFDFALTGVDISDHMLEKAKNKPKILNANFETGNIFSLDHADDSFSLVVCIRFMDWVSENDLEKAFTELARVTKGAIIVNIPTYTQLADIRPYSLSAFLRLIRQYKLRFYLARTRSDSVIHKKSSIKRIVEQLGLYVDDKVCIDHNYGRDWLKGVDRDIYLFKKHKS